MTFMEAIARQEGFLVKGSLAQRRNNPGNIEQGPFAQSRGALPPDKSRFAAWPTAEAGFIAMRDLLVSGYAGLTVAQAINKWAPSNENDTSTYVKNVCKWTGLTASTILTAEIIGQTDPTDEEVQAYVNRQGGRRK